MQWAMRIEHALEHNRFVLYGQRIEALTDEMLLAARRFCFAKSMSCRPISRMTGATARSVSMMNG